MPYHNCEWTLLCCWKPTPKKGLGLKYKDIELPQIKMIPPSIGRDIIPRPQALSTLKNAAGYPNAMLVAPAGSGKTTLLTTWADQDPSVAWVSIDREDNDPARFWAYLLASVQTNCTDLSLSAPIITAEIGNALLTSYLNEFSNKLSATGQPISIVLDNYHCFRVTVQSLGSEGRRHIGFVIAFHRGY